MEAHVSLSTISRKVASDSECIMQVGASRSVWIVARWDKYKIIVQESDFKTN